MTRKSRFTVLACSGLLLMLGVGVADAQMDARDIPNVKGPLVLQGGSCTTDKERVGGEVAVFSRSCGHAYGFKPSREDDANRNYDVVWLQTYVDPRHGYCATDVTSKIVVPKGSRIETKAPRKERTDERVRFQTRLVARAGGTADRNGVIKQGFALYPRVMDPTLDGRNFKLEWRGNTDKALAFALGVEISYPAGDPPADDPQGNVSSSLQSC